MASVGGKVGRFYIAVTIFAAAAFATPADSADRRRAHQETQYITTDDVQAEVDFGREVAARIIGKYSLYENKKLTRYLNLLGKALAGNTNRPELNFTFGVLDTDIINAFSAPGGYIFITKGAINSMEDEAELAGVIAHELIHVTEKHIVKELGIKGSESSAVAGIGRLIGGATDVAKVAFSQAVDKAENILFNRGYQQKDEIEADRLGTLLIYSMNYNPTSLIGYFKKIKGIEGEPTGSIKKLHPPFDERIKSIFSIIAEDGLKQDGTLRKKERFDANI